MSGGARRKCNRWRSDGLLARVLGIASPSRMAARCASCEKAGQRGCGLPERFRGVAR